MKRILIIFSFLLPVFFFSCTDKPATEKKIKQKSVDATPEGDVKSERFYVKDGSQYHKSFLDELKVYTGKVSLIENFIVTDMDTTYFPEELRKDSLYIFMAEKDSVSYRLHARRNNLTTLQFSYEESINGIIRYKKSGEAILKPTFFLASETDEDDSGGDMYGSSEYVMPAQQEYFNVRIGIGTDEEKRLRASLVFSHLGKQENEDKPVTLRTKATL
jgi:hypothetical protein